MTFAGAQANGNGFIGHEVVPAPAPWRPDGTRFSSHPVPNLEIYLRATSVDAFDFTTGEELASGTNAGWGGIVEVPHELQAAGLTGRLAFSIVGAVLDTESPSDYVLDLGALTQTHVFRHATIRFYEERSAEWVHLADFTEVVLRTEATFSGVSFGDADVFIDSYRGMVPPEAGVDCVNILQATGSQPYVVDESGTTDRGRYGWFDFDMTVIGEARAL